MLLDLSSIGNFSSPFSSKGLVYGRHSSHWYPCLVCKEAKDSWSRCIEVNGTGDLFIFYFLSVLPVHCKEAHQADEVMCCWGHLLFGCFLPWTSISTPSVPVFFTACQTVMKFCVKCFESIFLMAKWHFKKQFHYYEWIWNDSPYIS